MSNGIRVTRLGHVALEVANLSAAAEFYQDRWGLDVADEGRDALFMRADGPDHHVLALRSGVRQSVHHYAWEVAGRDDLERAAERLARLETPIIYGPAPADEPGIGLCLRFQDPDGHVLELYCGNETIRDPYGEREVKPLALNHIVLRVRDLERAERFYVELLGFRPSDWIENLMTFLRCSPNHHSLAFIKSEQSNMHHTAFEVRGWEDIARGVYFLGERRVPRVWGPGRHGPGNNIFAYFQDPEGNIMEYTCEVQQIADEASWRPKVWQPTPQAADQWGQPMPEVMY